MVTKTRKESANKKKKIKVLNLNKETYGGQSGGAYSAL